MTPEAEAPTEPAAMTFSDLGLGEPVLKALRDVGYETPSAIQAATIPTLAFVPADGWAVPEIAAVDKDRDGRPFDPTIKMVTAEDEEILVDPGIDGLEMRAG